MVPNQEWTIDEAHPCTVSIEDHSKLRRFGEGRRWQNSRGRARCVICVLVKLLGLGLFAVSEEAREDDIISLGYTYVCLMDSPIHKITDNKGSLDQHENDKHRC